MNLSSRLTKLEAMHAPAGRVVTVFGASEAQHQAQIAEVEAVIGKLKPSDLTICIRLFAGAVPKPTLVNGKTLEACAC